MSKSDPIYRVPDEAERKHGAIAVRRSDGALFDGSRFFSLQGESSALQPDVMSEEEEAAFEEWLSRIPKFESSPQPPSPWIQVQETARIGVDSRKATGLRERGAPGEVSCG